MKRSISVIYVIVFALVFTTNSYSQNNEAVDFNIKRRPIITVKILEITSVPNPNDSLYDDCIFTTRVEILDKGSHDHLKNQIVIGFMGFQDRQLLPATSYQIGDKVHVELVDFNDEEKKLGDIQRVDQIAERDLDFYFGINDYKVISPQEQNRERNDRLQKNPVRLTYIQNDIKTIQKQLSASMDKDWQKWHENLALFRFDLNKSMGKGFNGWVFNYPAYNPYFQVEDIEKPVDGGINPLSVIVDFADQLESRGIDFIYVLIPSKEMVYPENYSNHIPADKIVFPARQRFIGQLLANNIEVIDLLPIFLNERNKTDEILYWSPTTDHHISNYAMRIIAEKVVDRLNRYEFIRHRSKSAPLLTTDNVEINGIRAQRVLSTDGNLYKDPKSSPVLVLTDSHGGFFHNDGRPFNIMSAGITAHMARLSGVAPSLMRADIPHIVNRFPRSWWYGRRCVILIHMDVHWHSPSFVWQPAFLPKD